MNEVTAIALFILWMAFVGADPNSKENIFNQFFSYYQTYDPADYPGE